MVDMVSLNSKRGQPQQRWPMDVTVACAIPNSFFHSSTDRLLSDPELSAAESPLADKKAPGVMRLPELPNRTMKGPALPHGKYIKYVIIKKKKKRESHPNILFRLREWRIQ